MLPIGVFINEIGVWIYEAVSGAKSGRFELCGQCIFDGSSKSNVVLGGIIPL